MREMEAGERLEALVDKVSVPRDLEAFARTTGNRFVGSVRTDGGWHVTLERLPGSRLGRRPDPADPR